MCSYGTDILQSISEVVTIPFFSRLLKFGGNSIDVPVKPYHVLFFKEVLHPFYIFQVYAVAVWCSSEYYYYSGELG